jgi:quercetin dioxygenase-like cupin family protein
MSQQASSSPSSIETGARTVRRIITGHSAEGRAVVVSDDTVPAGLLAEDSERTDTFFFPMWATYEMPIDLTDGALERQAAGKKQTIVGSGQGSVMRIGEMAAGSRSPMHRTESLDYGICLAGEIEMELDSGETVTVRAGDVVIQRGTNHVWHNRSDHPCRFAWILIDARPVEVDGKPLGTSWVHGA